MSKNIETMYPLTSSQKGMLLESLGAQPGIHVEQGILELHGELDVDAFEQAWQTVVKRHAILRTAFVWNAHSEPVQVVLQRVEVPLQQADWSELPASDQEARLEQYLEADRELGFTPKRAPLLRLALFRTDARVHRFVLTFHHILMDGWSLSLVLAEALAAYEAITHGRELSLPTPQPYRSYIAWLREQSSSDAKAYWQEYLRGFSGVTPLGPEHTEVPNNLPEGYAEQIVELSDELADALTKAAREHHVTLGTLFQVVWSLLISRYTGQQDIVFGTTVSGRPPSLPGALSMVGLFINTVPMRLQIPASGELWSWLQSVQLERAAGREFDYCSSGQIHHWSELENAGSLYESILVFENYPEDSSGLEHASVTVNMLESRTVGARTVFPVTILVGSRAGLSIKLIHRRNRLDEDGCATILGHFLTLLTAISAEPEPELSSLLEQIPADEAPSLYPRAVPLSREMRRFVSPRDATELKLATIWQTILGHDDIGVYDSFFELGGHSLLALDMMARIRDQFAVELPMATLLEFPTIDANASKLRESEESKAWTPLVPIRAEGRRKPFFCVPGGAIDAISLHPLAHALDAEHPFYGIQPQGLDGRQPPHRTIEEMAAATVEVIRATQPVGPYYIGGHSFGAHVAYEVTQQLRAVGCEVGVLAIVDAAASTRGLESGPAVPRRNDTDRLTRLLSLVRRFFGRDIELGLEFGDQEPADLVEHVSVKLAAAQILPTGLGADRVRAYLTVGEAASLAFDAYRPGGRYPVRTVVFRARETHSDDAVLSLDQEPGDDTLGWRALVGDDIVTRWVQGDHVSIMTQPYVQAMANMLRDAILGRV